MIDLYIIDLYARSIFVLNLFCCDCSKVESGDQTVGWLIMKQCSVQTLMSGVTGTGWAMGLLEPSTLDITR